MYDRPRPKLPNASSRRTYRYQCQLPRCTVQDKATRTTPRHEDVRPTFADPPQGRRSPPSTTPPTPLHATGHFLRAAAAAATVAAAADWDGDNGHFETKPTPPLVPSRQPEAPTSFRPQPRTDLGHLPSRAPATQQGERTLLFRGCLFANGALLDEFACDDSKDLFDALAIFCTDFVAAVPARCGIDGVKGPVATAAHARQRRSTGRM